jgi:hypothetical protein
MVPDRLLSSALRCHRWMATVTGNAVANGTTLGCSAQVHAARIALRAWRMAVAEQAEEYQISNEPSEIHRGPVWVSRRTNLTRNDEDRVLPGRRNRCACP